jgi:hypothetical protein
MRTKPKVFYTFSTISLLLVALLFGSMVYTSFNNPFVTTQTSDLLLAISSEFPAATDENLTRIVNSTIKNNFMLDYVPIIFMGLYLISLLVMLRYIARDNIVTPYPKALKLTDEISAPKKNEDDTWHELT